jgi:molybdenum cofactor cytidylyltransferase
LIRSATLLQIADALAQHAVVVPVYRGQRGHPVGFAASCREALLALQGDQGAARVVQSHGACMVAVDDRGVCTDIDTLADLHAAEALLAQRAAGG